MSEDAWRFLPVAAIAAAVLGACGYTLIGSRAVMPSVSDAAGQLTLTSEAMAERRVSQIFRVGFTGLDSVTLRFARGPAEPFGPLVIELVEIGKGGATRVVRQESVPATRALSASEYTFAFRPVETWEPTTFRLDVKMPSAPAGRGIRVFAVEGHHLPDSTLMINDAEGFADLVFRTSTAWPTLWSRLVRHLRRPDWNTPDRGLLAALAVVAFGAFVIVCGAVARGRTAGL